jgi:hypothetical protein
MGLNAKEHCSMRKLLFPAVMSLAALAWTVSPARADIVLTITNGSSPGTFTVSSSGSTQSDGKVDVVNNSSYVISQLAVTSTIPSSFTNFDGDGPFGSGSYTGPNQTFSNPTSLTANVNFTGATIYGPLGLAPGATGFFGIEGHSSSGGDPVFTIGSSSLGATVTQASPIPEPGTMLVLGLGLAGLAGYGLRRKRSA